MLRRMRPFFFFFFFFKTLVFCVFVGKCETHILDLFGLSIVVYETLFSPALSIAFMQQHYAVGIYVLVYIYSLLQNHDLQPSTLIVYH